MKIISLLELVVSSAVVVAVTAASGIHPYDQTGLSINGVPVHDRLHWMRVANQAIYKSNNPCPQYPFGSAIVNTTSNELICVTTNEVETTGDPTLHGEITAIRKCTQLLRDRGFTVKETLAAWKDFSLYTNGEPCPMCMAAMRWAGFKEVIYGTSMKSVVQQGWSQIFIPSHYILEKSYSMGHMTLLLGEILTNETDVMFAHQFNESAPCPLGCQRELIAGHRVSSCQPVQNWREQVEKHLGKGAVSHSHDEL